MKTKLLYGETGLNVEVPDNAVVIEPKHLDSVLDEKAAVLYAIRNPIESRPLREMVKETDTVAIVISDITRATPNHKLVPWLLEELSHVPLKNFVIINGTGAHRDQTKEEFIQMLGQWVVDNVKVINHHAQDPSSMKKIGTSSFGPDVYLNKEYVEADFRIVTGFIEPHFFAGFSGGPKGILPGIASIETLLTFHNARMIGDVRSTWGNVENNPLQEMTREANRMCKPHFMLNVILNGQKEIVDVFAGELFAAHKVGCEVAKGHAMQKCDNRFDVVITSNSGYPLDQNLYQAVKGMSAAQQVVKQGGTIICAAECSDGLPSHGNFGTILKMRDTPETLLEMINEPSFHMFDQWEAQKLAMILTWADVYVYSKLTDEQVISSMCKPTHNIEQTLHELKGKYGENMTVAVLPVGPLTIPYVED